MPKKFLPADGSGIRDNLSFESLTITPDQRFLFTAIENALLQDGPKADLGQPSLSRMVKFDLASGRAVAEYIYRVAPAAHAPRSANGSRSNGLSELAAVDDQGTLLSLERSYSEGVGVTVKLYYARMQGAADVSGVGSLMGGAEKNLAPVSKVELADFNQWLPWVDNLEAMTFGPRLPDGRRVLIVVSDNNFSSVQSTQFVALALKF